MDKKSLLEQVRNDEVNFISLQFTDIIGSVKSLDIPVEQLPEVLDDGIWFDGSSVEGFSRIQESDMHLRADMQTYAVLPFSPAAFKRARILCEVFKQNGEPFEGDPRGVLKRNLDKLKSERGWVLNVGPEPEFYLFKKRDGNEHMHPVPYDVGGYFDFSANDQALNVRTELMATLQEMGLKVEVGHHECGLGQHEIDFKFADALKTADNIMTFKSAVKAIAAHNGLIASFMPKPLYGAAGSGMHCHQSISSLEGENLFYEASDSANLSLMAKHYLAGLLAHAKSMAAVVAPCVNSYKRLVPGYEAPVYIGWAQVNRSALVRVPKIINGNKKAVRIELRFPDPSANPYLAINAMLAAGLDGIERELELAAPLNNINVFNLSEKEREAMQIGVLPGSLIEAIEEFKKDDLMERAMGSSLYQKFLASRLAEWEDYRTSVSDWEVARYLETI
ncbi:MAG: type I glutamate--ammonia ligase [Anaerolineaceae bacterium]|nr:type I glutamate--ammonia ligase [Anaerolineaceae bacterium]